MIYFITDGCGRVKIGHSHDPASRLRALQAGSAVQLTLAASLVGTKPEERALHRLYAEHHLRGEWFKIEGTLAHCLRRLRARNQYTGLCT